jgi:hypothetical protein
MLNPIFAKDRNFWQIFEIKKTPVNREIGKFWSYAKLKNAG